MIAQLDLYSFPTALLIIRIILGILFISSGYDKIVRIGVSKVQAEYKNQLRNFNFSDSIFQFTAIFSSWSELIGGVLILFGLFKFIALTLLGLDLILVCIAMVLLQPLYDMKLILPRLLLILFLLLAGSTFDLFSFDYLLFYK